MLKGVARVWFNSESFQTIPTFHSIRVRFHSESKNRILRTRNRPSLLGMKPDSILKIESGPARLALLLGGAGILQEMASKSEDHYSLLFVSLSFILCLSYSLTYFTPLYPVLILSHHYITVTLLLLPLVLYRLSTSEEMGTLHSKGRRLPIYVGWGRVCST